jgi:ABC-type hemin transport system ATPase subunit
MLLVLGRPGSGCSTMLKTIAGETHGLYVADNSHINYQGKFQCLSLVYDTYVLPRHIICPDAKAIPWGGRLQC